MAKLSERLQDSARSGVYRTRGADEIAAAVRGGKSSFARIPLQGITEKTALLRAIADTLGFPDWFGENWDALEDCLTDLSWRRAAGHVLVFDGFQSVSHDDLGVLIDVLAAAAEFWAGQGKPFFAVFNDPQGLLADSLAEA